MCVSQNSVVISGYGASHDIKKRFSDFSNVHLFLWAQMSISYVSAPSDGATSLSIYAAVMTGLERLVLADVLTSAHVDDVIKMAVDR